MPMLFGLILGVILTIAGTFAYDSSTGRAANGLSATAAEGQAPLVNWEVVNKDWAEFQVSVQHMSADLQKTLRRHVG